MADEMERKSYIPRKVQNTRSNYGQKDAVANCIYKYTY